VINNVTQIINIINNVTTNGTGGPVTPPPPTNDTGGNDTGGVIEPEPLPVNLIWDTTDGSTAPATFEFTADVGGGTEPYTYSWDFGDGQQQTTGEQAVSTVNHTFENPGSYTVTVTVTDGTGRTGFDSTSVHVDPAPTAGEPTTNETEELTPPPTEGGAEPPTIDTLGQ
jgi:PKD repeat protein